MIKKQKIRFAVVNMLILSLILLTALSGMYLMMMKLEVNTSEGIMTTLMDYYNTNPQFSPKASVEEKSISNIEEAPVTAVPQILYEQDEAEVSPADTGFRIMQIEMEKSTSSYNYNPWSYSEGGFQNNWEQYQWNPDDNQWQWPQNGNQWSQQQWPQNGNQWGGQQWPGQVPWITTAQSTQEHHQSSQESHHAEPQQPAESPEPYQSEAHYDPAPSEPEPAVTAPPETSTHTTTPEDTTVVTTVSSAVSTEKKSEKQTKATPPATTPYNGNLSRSHILAEISNNGSIIGTSYRYFSNLFDDFSLENRHKYEIEVEDNLKKIIQSKKSSGKVTIGSVSYRFIISKETNSDNSLIILLDRSTESSTISRLLFVFIIIGCLGLVLVAIASVLLANWTIIPIENAWNKQKQFIADASHELKTPLTVIAANTDVVLSNPTESVQEQERWLKYIQDETFRMSKLVNELLYIARSDANQIKMDMTEFDISKTVSSVCLAFESLVYESGRELVSDISPHLKFYGDEDRIKQLVTILIDNAIKYSIVKTQISLSLFRNNQNRIKLCISNKCEELTDENISKLFDRFYRVDSSRNSKTGGNGLGLNIAQTIAEAHNGSINVNYKYGIISFTITL